MPLPTTPPLGSVVQHPPNFRMSELPGDMYPSLIGVYCDHCATTVEADYIVSTQDDQATKFGYARAHLRTLGWVCDAWVDLCPHCVAVR